MRGRTSNDEQEAFRRSVRAFLTERVLPHVAEWEVAKSVPKSLYAEFGRLGVTGIRIPQEFGGAGEKSFIYNVILAEEVMHTGAVSGALQLHLNVVLPYFLDLATPEQQSRWFPAFVSGESVTAMPMTEPGTGSDLAGISASAVLDGDAYVLDGAKTFITGGMNADLVVVVARTSRSETDRRAGLTLLVVEEGMTGFSRGRNLDKLGMKSQDTSELFFDNVQVPVANRLGAEGNAFAYLTANLPQERMSIAISAQASSERAIDLTLDYTRERKAFGTPIASFQNTKFVLAGLSAKVEAGRHMVDRAIEELDARSLTVADAARVKLFTTEVQAEVMDACLQLHGGYGYMLEYPISRMYADARVSRIYGGSSEIMKVIIAKDLGL
ncbi:MAG TPA: acyl-CoA dehydrogenase family protein [Dermatophilaceae bacterium]